MTFAKTVSNKTLHKVAEIKDMDGVLQVVIQPQMKESLVRSEYVPIANILNYPKKWGRKLAAKTLLEYHIKNMETIIEQSTSRLIRLKECMERVDEWDENDQ